MVFTGVPAYCSLIIMPGAATVAWSGRRPWPPNSLEILMCVCLKKVGTVWVWGRSSGVSILSLYPRSDVDPDSIPGAAMLDRSFILATSAIRLYYRGPCLSIRPYLGESDVKLSHPSIHPLSPRKHAQEVHSLPKTHKKSPLSLKSKQKNPLSL